MSATSEAVNEYQCDSCDWIYRASENEGIGFDAQAEGWQCPQCQAERDHFKLLVPPDDDLGDDDDSFEPKADISAGAVIRTKKSEPDVETLKRRWDRGKLDTQPDFQRYEVWSNQKRSRLVESVLLGLPIPLFYFAEEQDGREVVIDGQQRLTSLFRFVKDEYKLVGLGPLRSLDGSKFSKLPEDLQDRINETTLSIVTILKDSDPDVRFSMFERLNEGATKLNDQELRNSVYRGEYNDLLKKLSELPDFRELLRQDGPHKRMVDVELVLRFMAFYNQTYLKHPDKKTKEFLNREMELYAVRKAVERNKAQKAFKEALAASKTVFGMNAFRRFAAGTSGKVNGGWESKFNRALFDVEMFGFTRYPRSLVTKSADAIREAALDLMSNEEFVDLISHTISEKKRIERRFKMWLEMLGGVLDDQSQGPRLFPTKLKIDLFAKDPTCKICKQQIMTLEDAHVDHVKAHSVGGATTDDNAALTHRFCNISKQAKPSKVD